VTKIGFTEAWHWEMMKGNTMGWERKARELRITMNKREYIFVKSQ
jgi:hypothetical protein